MTDDNIKAFLDDLTALSQRHGITIGGCGCCGSPFLTEPEQPGRYIIKKGAWDSYENLEWEDDDGR